MSKQTSITCIKLKQTQDELDNDEITFEEKHKDVIYQVTYKKVYATNNSNKNNDNNTNNSNNCGLVYTRIKTKQIKYGTIDKIIDHFTNLNGDLDSNIVNTFLATYRTFIDTKLFIQLLLNKYDNIIPASLDITEEIRINYVKSFRSIIITWLDSYLIDFNDSPKFNNLKLILKFCSKYSNDFNDLINYIKRNLDTLENKLNDFSVIQRKSNFCFNLVLFLNE
jgi:hypothetical protein